MTDRTRDDHTDALRRRLCKPAPAPRRWARVPGATLLGAQAQARIRLEAIQGEKIEVLLVKSPRGDLLSKYHKEFEDMTGIEVGSEMVPEQQQRQKAVIEFNSGNPSFDVIALSYHVQKRQFAQEQLADRSAPDDQRSTAGRSEPRFRRFRARAASITRSRPDGRVDEPAVQPRSLGRLLQQGAVRRQGRRVPEDVRRNDRCRRASSTIPARACRVCRTRPEERQRAGVDELPPRLRRDGFIDKSGKLMTDSPEAIESAKMYQTLLAKYGPQGVAGYNWNEAQSLFLQGKAAMWLDGIGFAQPLEDPTKSRIVGKVGYGVMPAGPKQQVSALFADGEGISTFSKKKGPAWFYLQWASNKANQTRMLQAAAGAPVRTSAYAAAQASSDFKSPKEWVECMLTSAKIAQPGLPIIAAVTEFRDTFGIALTNMINGADPAAELEARDRRVPAGPRQDREGLTPTPAPSDDGAGSRIGFRDERGSADACPRPGFLARRRRELSAVRRAGATGRRRRHHLSLGVHRLDERVRLEDRLGRAFRRVR